MCSYIHDSASEFFFSIFSRVCHVLLPCHFDVFNVVVLCISLSVSVCVFS